MEPPSTGCSFTAHSTVLLAIIIPEGSRYHQPGKPPRARPNRNGGRAASERASTAARVTACVFGVGYGLNTTGRRALGSCHPESCPDQVIWNVRSAAVLS